MLEPIEVKNSALMFFLMDGESGTPLVNFLCKSSELNCKLEPDAIEGTYTFTSLPLTLTVAEPFTWVLSKDPVGCPNGFFED